MKPTYFERAIFISWYCSKRDCAFCYLSSRQTPQDPLRDRRSLKSILAEAQICKACDWKVEFISGGCDTYTNEELLNIISSIYKITQQKQWLNLGILNETQMRLFKPYTEGVCGTVETLTSKRNKICPSKPLKEIENMFKIADKLKLKKTITIILGIGETLEDFKHLKAFIEKHNLDRITFYRLKPQKNTIFENAEPITSEYYEAWIKKTRDNFPKIKIVVGSWLTHLDEISILLKAGADSITKFPSIRKFNTKDARTIEAEVNKVAIFKSNLTKVPKIKTTNKALKKYLKRMGSNQ